MRRKYGDCQREDGNCTQCEMVIDRKDCRGKKISSLEWARLAVGMGQKELSERSGVYLRQIQRVEWGESEAGNLTARNILALADALGVDPRELF